MLGGQLSWKGNLSEIDILLGYLEMFRFHDFMSSFCEMGVRKKFKLFKCGHSFEAHDVEISNM